MQIINKTQAEAQTEADDLNFFYIGETLEGVFTAVIGQSNKYFSCTIPTGRLAEFNAGDTTKQNNFFQFSITAELNQDAANDFVTLWEAEYAKVYP